MAFLRWALPRLDMRWPGFRKVRRQVCKRIGRRLRELGLPDLAAYRVRLEEDPAEWQLMDGFCRITISRFYRDRGVFDALGTSVLTDLADATKARGERALRCLSVGCASGEEAYTLKLLWELERTGKHQALAVHITGIDSHPRMLERANRGCFPEGSLKDLPESWKDRAFDRIGGEYCVREQYREGLHFMRCDVRRSLPSGPFDLVLCRNLVFTYFVDALQRRILARLRERMHEHGALVVGIHESLPDGPTGFVPWNGLRCTYRRV